MKTYYWDARPGFFTVPATGEGDGDPSSFGGCVGEWYRTILIRINALSNHALEGKADRIIAPPDVGTILEHLTMFRPAIQDLTDDCCFTERIGTISGKYDVHISKFQIPDLVVVASNTDYAFLKIKGMPICQTDQE